MTPPTLKGSGLVFRGPSARPPGLAQTGHKEDRMKRFLVLPVTIHKDCADRSGVHLAAMHHHKLSWEGSTIMDQSSLTDLISRGQRHAFYREACSNGSLCTLRQHFRLPYRPRSNALIFILVTMLEGSFISIQSPSHGTSPWNFTISLFHHSLASGLVKST